MAAISVGFMSLGCAKNLVDSQIMAGTLLENGLLLAPKPDEADVIIINTCAFIEEAREESFDAIAQACRAKTEGRCRAVLVAGCLPQRYQDDLAERVPEVDGFLGLDELAQTGEIVSRLARGERHLTALSPQARRLFDPGEQLVVFSGGAHAYLKIAEGCDHHCTFCAIPGIRGRHRSREPKAILTEAARLLDAGFRELDVISQDITGYGRDRSDAMTLADLVQALDRQ